MKRSELEKYLGQRVEIKLFDNKVLAGTLHKTGESEYKRDPNLYLPRNYYFVEPAGMYGNFLFRCSHVKKLYVW